MRCAIRPGGLEGERQETVVSASQPLVGERRAGDVPAEPLEACSVVGSDSDRGVEVEEGALATQARELALAAPSVLEAPDAAAGSLAHCDAVRRGGRLDGEERVLLGLGRPLLVEASAAQGALDTSANGLDQALHLLAARRRHGVEGELAVWLRVVAVEAKEVEVEVEVQRRAEELVEADGAELWRGVTRGPRLLAVPAEDHPDEDAKNSLTKGRSPRQPEAQRHGKGDDPLADGYDREDAVDEVCGGLVDATSSARWTEATALAGERHRPVLVAALAL